LLNVVGQIPHLSDYFGVWSMYEPVFRAAVDRINLMDLRSHVNSAEAAESVNNQYGDEYEVTRDGIALFQIQGPMMKSVSSLSGGTSTIRLRQQFRSARKNPDVVGGLLIADTPGGTAKGNRDLADEVAAFAAAKPLYGFVDDLVASAGVSILSQTTKRFANNPTALYGAMGTYSVLIDAKQAADKAGVVVHVVKAGDFKGMGELGTAISEAQLAEAQRIVNALNDEYVTLIARGLEMPLAQVTKLADGRIHPAQQAVEMGLIDGIQSYEQTYRQLLNEVGSRKSAKPKSPTSQVPALKGDTMPQEKNENSEPQPASLAELKQKFPKSTADWREKQIEGKATLQEAAVAYAEFQEERATSLQKQLDERSEGKDKGGKPASPGHQPLREKQASAKRQSAKDDEEDDDEETQLGYTGDAFADFNASVRSICGRNPTLQTRQAAIRQVASRDPELYQAYLLATNPGRRQQRVLTEKMESLVQQ
jgi:signal peptide peptidase SppA